MNKSPELPPCPDCGAPSRVWTSTDTSSGRTSGHLLCERCQRQGPSFSVCVPHPPADMVGLVEECAAHEGWDRSGNRSVSA